MTSEAIQTIQRDPDYQKNCEANPNYLQNTLTSLFTSKARDLTISLYQEKKLLIQQLSIQYAKKTYQSAVEEKSLSPILQTISCIAIELFTNEAALHVLAPQRAWQSITVQIIQSFSGENQSSIAPPPYEERISALTHLLPKPHAHFLAEDQAFFFDFLLDIQKKGTSIPETSFLLQNMDLTLCLKTPKEWLDFAMSVGGIDIAMQWQAKFWLDFSEKQLQKVFHHHLVQTFQVDKLRQIFHKELSWKEEKVLTAFFLELNDQTKKEHLVMRSIQRRYELLTVKLLGCLEFPLPFPLFLLNAAREKKLPFVIAFLSAQIRKQLDHPDCKDEMRGETLEAAIKWEQEELIDEILSKKIPSRNRGRAAILAAQSNKTDLFKKLWNPELIDPQDQDEILYFAAASGNRDIVQLRLASNSLLSPKARQKALSMAKSHNHNLQDLLGTWIQGMIEDYLSERDLILKA